MAKNSKNKKKEAAKGEMIMNIITYVMIALIVAGACYFAYVKISENKITDTESTSGQTSSGTSSGNSTGTTTDTESTTPVTVTFTNEYTATHYVEMEIESYGTLKISLDATKAPITVDNFVGLIKQGFYDGLTFHRAQDGFVVQGGDPLGNGRGGSGKSIKGEFAQNGVANPLAHTRGAISMARSGYDYNSADSQFFIVVDDKARQSLDGGYAAFGYVTEGMEIIDKICADTVATNASGSLNREDQPVIKKVTVTEA